MIKLKIERTNQFKKDIKLSKRRGKDGTALLAVMEQICRKEKLSAHYRDHALTGNWVLHRELHISNDWLLIYKLIPEKNTVVFVRTGSHSDLFD